MGVAAAEIYSDGHGGSALPNGWDTASFYAGPVLDTTADDAEHNDAGLYLPPKNVEVTSEPHSLLTFNHLEWNSVYWRSLTFNNC